jgi:hypothetical protein
MGIRLLVWLVLVPVAAASAAEPAKTPYLLADHLFLDTVRGDGAVTEFELPAKAP